MAYKTIHAKSISYGGTRSLDKIKYIVIHYTGNNGDTAEGNANYFKNSNTREAGAHFFVSRDGTVIRSIKMKYIAWAVGGVYSTSGDAGSYYKKCTNSNSVSIELCDIATKNCSSAQIKAVKKLIKYIRKKCPNAKTIIRHYDVNGKTCPARYITASKWKKLKEKITPKDF